MIKLRPTGTTGLPLDMDSLGYKYNRDINGNLVNNRLTHVADAVNSANYTVDIDNQSANNYTYDRIGNLTSDAAEHLDAVRWTVYGKINRIVKSNGGSTVIDYGYDPGGNRTYKAVNSNDTITSTFYVRDAQGNVLAIYSKKGNEGLKWDEQHLYGSSRLGMWRYDTIVPESAPVVAEANSIYDSLLLGSRSYELSNHLGNVLATISDKKIGNDSSGVVNYYIAEVLSQSDYYPGGMLMPGREFSKGTEYRFGQNGQEKSTEINKNSYTAEFWQYDARIVRRWNPDPKPNVAVSLYAAFEDNPIFNRDPLGDTTVPNAPRGFAYTGGTYGYQKKQEINLSYKSSSRVYNVIDNAGDRFLIRETKQLVDGYNGMQEWKTSRSYWSERPEPKGTNYANDAHWIPYMDAGQTAHAQTKDVTKILIGTPVAAAAIVFAAPVVIESGVLQYGGNLLRSGLQYGYKTYGRDFAINTAKQFFSSGGNPSAIDWFDVGTSTLNPFKKFGTAGAFMNEGLNSLVDYKQGSFRVALYNKRASDIAIDFGFGQIKAMGKTSFNTLGGGNLNRDFFWDVGVGAAKTAAKSSIQK